MAATGEVATEEELGGAVMHTTISGLGDYLAEDDRDALRIAREIVAHLDWPRDAGAGAARPHRPPRLDPEELLGVMPADLKRPVDMRQAIARFVDDSDFLEFGAATAARRSAAMRRSRAARSASSPTTGRSTSPARTRRPTSSRPAASRGRRCST
jgi:acetyl-CoA carboxylase carboxyltransferase component